LRALREMDFGIWDGMDWRDVAARDPDLSRRFWEDLAICARRMAKAGMTSAPVSPAWSMI